ncbi:zwei Ig domain protein zig-8-like [Macrobrachium rosenbergii]|uniref:zwei Ig domain protein zig-8-like n=1 Tax=Macrobrachium rosenbergii TaxID=79674 RepID=UPI0034D6D77A
MVVPSLHYPPPASHPPNGHHHHSGRRAGRSSEGTSSGSSGGRQLGMNLSDNSSSPVEPIKPLLELSSGGSGGPLIMPPHPVFDEAAPKNVSALAGNAAYLHCLVHNLSNKSVSWIRQRDLHILTVGLYTYTTDERYQVIHSQGSQDWILKIKYAQVRDSGMYECQVSTKPVRTYSVYLNVFAPKAEIVGAPDMHVDKGSTINLTCVIAHSPQPPAYIFWYHNGQVVSNDSPRGGIQVYAESGNVTNGYLLIKNAQLPDTGNYTCAPSNTDPTSIRVHVLKGESPAAMQTNKAAASFKTRATIAHSVLSCILTLLLPSFFTSGSSIVSSIVGTTLKGGGGT